MISKAVKGQKYCFRNEIVEVAYLALSDRGPTVEGYFKGNWEVFSQAEFLAEAEEIPEPVMVSRDDIKKELQAIRETRKTLRKSVDNGLGVLRTSDLLMMHVTLEDTVSKHALLCRLFGVECIKNIEETL